MKVNINQLTSNLNALAIENNISEIYVILDIKLKSTNNKFMFPYTLSKYRKGINPICALYEEYQISLYKKHKNKFDKWVCKIIKENIKEIISALKEDIQLLSNYIKHNDDYINHRYVLLLRKFILYYEYFTNIFYL